MKTLVLAVLLLTPLLRAQTGVVEGRVVDSVTKAGVAGVDVRVWTRDATRYQTSTDAGGAFRVGGMKDGVYNFSLEKPGYASAAVGESQKVLRVFGTDPIRIELEMVPRASLSGRVLDGEGKPAAKVEVQIGAFTTVVTEEDGNFSLKDLDPGEYTLLAKPSVTELSPRSTEGERREVLPTYFPSVLDQEQAERITVTAGANLTGYEIKLRSAVVYRVRGTVLDDSGKPAAEARVTLLARGGKSGFGQIGMGATTLYMLGGLAGEQQALVTTGKDGKFEFPAVPAGDWLVHADWEQEWDNTLHRPKSQAGGAGVLIERKDSDDMLIRLAAPFQPKVEVDWGGARPDPRRQAALLLQAVDGPGLTMVMPEMESSPGITPGKYRVAAGVPVGDVYVASMTFGGVEVLGQVIDLQPGAPPLHVSYKKSSSSVRGTVAQGEGATVLFWPQRSADPDFTVMTSVRCGPNGNFESNAIAPGDYYAVALARVDSRSLSSPSVLRRLTAAAATVRVDEGSATVLQLSLTRTD